MTAETKAQARNTNSKTQALMTAETPAQTDKHHTHQHSCILLDHTHTSGDVYGSSGGDDDDDNNNNKKCNVISDVRRVTSPKNNTLLLLLCGHNQHADYYIW